MARRFLFIVNPAAAAGGGGARWAAVRAELRRRGVTGEQRVTSRPGHGLEIVREAAAAVDVVVAVGGDGTVGEVASGILQAGAGARLGIVPFGTGNDVARQLGLGSLAQALESLAGSESAALDAIEVRYTDNADTRIRHALLFASVGLAGEVLRLTTPRVKRWFGQRLSYSVGFLRALVTYRAPQARVGTDAGDFAGRWLHICAGNSAWAGGGAMQLSPGAQWDDGRLDLCLIEALSRIETAWQFPKLVRGTFTGHPKVRYFRGTRMTLESEQPLPLQLDGELLGTTPATFTVRPQCLQVLAPVRPVRGHPLSGPP